MKRMKHCANVLNREELLALKISIRHTRCARLHANMFGFSLAFKKQNYLSSAPYSRLYWLNQIEIRWSTQSALNSLRVVTFLGRSKSRGGEGFWSEYPSFGLSCMSSVFLIFAHRLRSAEEDNPYGRCFSKHYKVIVNGHLLFFSLV